jgi:hypothetical protein
MTFWAYNWPRDDLLSHFPPFGPKNFHLNLDFGRRPHRELPGVTMIELQASMLTAELRVGTFRKPHVTA